jgi:hypothetical protein
MLSHLHRGNLLRPQPPDPLHQQWRARHEFSIVLAAQAVTAQPTPSGESNEVRWVPEAKLTGYTMDRSMRIRIDDFLSRSDSPLITKAPKPAAKGSVFTVGQSRAERHLHQPLSAGGNPKDSDLPSDYGLSFGQTQRDDRRLS